jgi:sulfite reductase beta subunit-like hemoprotein/NADPH-dependent glutamate synthase beta subunit-like oxidoreductase/ferredoxin
MQRRITHLKRSDEEAIKEAGLLLDFDEIARKGRMSHEETFIGKWYGIYNTRQPGYYMARVVVPAGILTTSQVRTVAAIAERYGMGRISITTRQALQFHWLRIQDLAPLMRDLSQAELTTFHGCGDVTRNVTACQWASCCLHARIDVAPYAKQTAETLSKARDLDDLPRKFKISFSGCGAGCAQPYINCVGVTALIRSRPGGRQEVGFRVVIGGGMGWRGFPAQTLYAFVPKELITHVCRAVGTLFRDHGDRHNRATSRLKFVVHRLGMEECRSIVDANLAAEGVDRANIEIEPVEDCGQIWPDRPLSEVEPRERSGLAIQGIMVPRGELNFHQLKDVARLSEQYGDKFVYTTHRQNLELHGVSPSRLPALCSEIEALGLGIQNFGGLDDMATCVGTTYCPMAVSRTRELNDLVQKVVRQKRYDPIRRAGVISVTGCPNACSPHRIVDIGFRGMRIREELGAAEGYRVLLGGSQERFGQFLGEFKTGDCPAVVSKVLDLFLEIRQDDETLTDSVCRLGIEPYRKAVAGLGFRYRMAPALAEYSVTTGESATLLDAKTIARDVPCQAACPAKTNVPEYIGRVARGDHEGAYRINQEDNVFPGVLGRVCVRPCESRCRHQWTNTLGPVAICHLKRSAADREAGRARQLEPWFDASGKRIAIVGGGPAGLTAARELRRYGHEVVLFERDKTLGGMMVQGIPEFRLPREIVGNEIAVIVETGVDVRLGQDITRAKVSEMLATYDAVLLATGAILATPLDLEGAPEAAGISGLEFMRRYNAGDPVAIAGDVVIVGGGFTAVDCARAARRILGQRNRVSAIMYRRGEEHMSASPEEIWQLRLEGIDIGTLVNPRGAHFEDGKIRGVVFSRNILGDAPEGSAKPPVIPVPDTEYEVPCDLLIYATGQERDLTLLPEGAGLTGDSGTRHHKLFVAGDFNTGPKDIISAVADAKQAAQTIDRFLTGAARRESVLAVTAAEETGRLRDHDLMAPPQMPVLPLNERATNREVELGHGDADTEINAWRCYLCNYKFEIDQDVCIHCDWCIKVSPRACIHKLTRLFRDEDGAPTGNIKTTTDEEATYIWIDSEQCIRCGACLRVCPVGAISLRRADIIRRSARGTGARP